MIDSLRATNLHVIDLKGLDCDHYEYKHSIKEPKSCFFYDLSVQTNANIVNSISHLVFKV